MDIYCGYPPTWASSLSECLVDSLSFIPHSLFIFVVIPNMIFRWIKIKSLDGAGRKPVRYPGHTARWLLSLALVAMQMLLIVEAAASDSLSQGMRLHLYLSPILSLIAVTLSIVFYAFIEHYNLAEFLLASLLYWSMFGVVMLLKFAVLLQQQLGMQHTRLVLVTFTLIATLIIVIIEVYLIYKLCYLCENKKTLLAPEELSHLTYIQPYVSFLSGLTWEWLSSILSIGLKQPIQMKDLGAIPDSEHSKTNFAKFKKVFDAEKARCEVLKRKPSLFRVYVLCYWPYLMVAGVAKISAELMIFISPLCVDGMVEYVFRVSHAVHVSTNNVTIPLVAQYVTHSQFLNNGFALAVIVLLVTLLQGSLWQNHFYYASRQGIRCKAALQAMVYDKALRLSTYSLSEGGLSVGQVLNHMSIDPINVFWLYYFCNSLWSVPIQLAVGIFLLYYQLGIAALISSFFILLLVPLNLVIAKYLADLQEEILKTSDTRLKQVNEVIQCIKLLKLYAWEFLFHNRIAATREREMQLLMKMAVLRAISSIVVDGMPLLATLITFTLYPFIETKPLTAGKVFSGLAIFNLLAIPLLVLPMIIAITVQAKVSTSRIVDFLLTPEINTQTIEYFGVDTPSINNHGVSENRLDIDVALAPSSEMSDFIPPSLKGEAGETLMEIENGSFSWDLDGKNIILQDVNLNIREGQLTVIVGSASSGKSSIVSALIGEMTKVKGSVQWKSGLKVAYSSQKPWLMNASLQDNILFGNEYDPYRYDEVLTCCCLKPDLEILPAGDMTEIGEKGIHLSGGQKQRISIARSMYSIADVVILDDPLSALDVIVGSHIFREGVVKQLLRRGRTVILVTHQVQYLPYAHQIIAMDAGHIVEVGGLKTIKAKNPDLYKEWKITLEQKPDAIGPKVEDRKPRRRSSLHAELHLADSRGGAASMKPAFSMISLSHLIHDQTEAEIEEAFNFDSNAGAVQEETGQLIQEEERDLGEVKIPVYIAYINNATLGLSLFTLLAYFARQCLRMTTDIWLATWSEESQRAHEQLSNITDTHSEVGYSEGYYVAIFAVLCTFAILSGFGATACLELCGLRAARAFHANMLEKVVMAPMGFFETTPVGRIINRFAGDTNIIDQKIPPLMDCLLYCLLYVCGGIVMNAIACPYFIISLIPIIIIYLFVQRFYTASCREIQRLDNITKSPVLSQFSETLGGLSTIRAFQSQGRFQERSCKLIDTNNTALLYLHTANVWMGIRLDYLGAVIVFMAAISSLGSGVTGGTTPGMVGLAIAYAIMISGFLNWMMRYISETEMYFNCVKHAKFYSQLPSEPYHREKGAEVEPDDDWPQNGEIQMRDVALRYGKSQEPAVYNVDLSVLPSQKLGIFGQTGSGKSSLSLGLYRLIEISRGRIYIDGIDSSRVPLLTLRSRLSIIPQNPILFEGSVRYNLDPEYIITDEDLWHALEIVQLKCVINGLDGKLDALISDVGENFSNGQRQLFCFARAILKNSKILIWHELTASADVHTDAVIQEVIKTAFADKTVLTIAHRVSTILQSDSILMLGEGQVLENDSPRALLKTKNSAFASMVKESQ